MIQMSPCLGVINQAYPKFTAVETLLNGNVGNFLLYFRFVFPVCFPNGYFMVDPDDPLCFPQPAS